VDFSELDEFEKKVDHVQRALAGGRGLRARLETIAGLAKVLISGCDGAGFALVVEDKTRSVGVTDAVVLEVDLVQYDTGEGPCLKAIEHGQVVRLDLTDVGEGWKHFAPGAIDAGVNSVLSLPVIADGSTVGALNLYSKSRHAFGADDEQLASKLADYAATAIVTSPLYVYSTELVADVLEQISEREVIDNAIGVVMAIEREDEEAARRRLTLRAAKYGETLFETAEWEIREQELRATRSRDAAPEGTDPE
jgi:GAF domain-containing protein